jgi:hypothetical protein
MTHEHDTVVVDRGDSSNVGLIVGIVAIVLVGLILWYVALGPGSGSGGGGGDTTQPVASPPPVELPSAAPS